jgi:protein-S-isoprenylcysteine O-methyltransferase Ste14
MNVTGQIVTIVVFFLVLVLLSFSGWSIPSPAAWVSDWLRLFGTVISIVAGLKLAWSVPQLLEGLVNALAARRSGE